MPMFNPSETSFGELYDYVAEHGTQEEVETAGDLFSVAISNVPEILSDLSHNKLMSMAAVVDWRYSFTPAAKAERQKIIAENRQGK